MSTPPRPPAPPRLQKIVQCVPNAANNIGAATGSGCNMALPYMQYCRKVCGFDCWPLQHALHLGHPLTAARPRCSPKRCAAPTLPPPQCVTGNPAQCLADGCLGGRSRDGSNLCSLDCKGCAAVGGRAAGQWQC